MKKIPDHACCKGSKKDRLGIVKSLSMLGKLKMCRLCIGHAIGQGNVDVLDQFASFDGFEYFDMSYLFTVALQRNKDWHGILSWICDKMQKKPPDRFLHRVIHVGNIDILNWLHERDFIEPP